MAQATQPGIALRDLHVAPYNPRRFIPDDSAWQEFKDSIRAHGGVYQPILVRAVEGKKTPFEVVAGQRRFLASLDVFGQDYQIPAYIKVMTDEQALAAATSENIDRERMNVVDEAEAAARILARCNGNRAEAAKRMGWSLSNLDNRLKLMACSVLVRDRLLYNKIPLGIAELLAGLTTAKQDELVATFDSTAVPTASDAKAMILAMSKSLPAAIFERTECGACQHNSAQQQSMFGKIEEGHCLNADCYDTKTENQLQVTVTGLNDDFQRIEIMRPGDNFRVIKLKAETVGEEQATACRSCKDFGAAVSGLPNKLGLVSRGLCFTPSCNEEKTKAFQQAQEALKTPPEPDQAAATSEDTPAPQNGATEPAKAKKDAAKPAMPAVVAKPTVGLSNAVLDFRDELYRRVVFKELAIDPVFSARFVMAIVLNEQGRIFKGDQVRESYRKAGLIGDKDHGHSLLSCMQTMAKIPQERAEATLPKLGATAIKELTRSELKELTKFANADLAEYFVLNDASGQRFLDSLTKNEIIAICDEVGLSAKMGKTFRSLSGGKKDAFIKAITSVADFEYKGIVPKVLQPAFEK